MFLFVNTYFSFPLVILEFTLIKPRDKTTQAYSASVTGVLKLNPLASKAVSIHPSGHMCQPPASSVAWAVRVGWVSNKLVFSWHCTWVHSFLWGFWWFSYFCPFWAVSPERDGKKAEWVLRLAPCFGHRSLHHPSAQNTCIQFSPRSTLSCWGRSLLLASDCELQIQRRPKSVPGIIKSWSTWFWSVFNQLQI